MTYLLIILMIVCATLSVCLGVSYFLREKKAGAVKYFLLALGISSGTWNLSYAVLCFAKTVSFAVFFRTIGVVSVDLFLYAEIVMFTKWCSYRNRLRYLIRVLFLALCVADIILFGHPDSNRYAVEDGFMRFYTNIRWRHDFHLAVIAAVVVCMILMAVTFGKKSEFKRERRFLAGLWISNWFLFFAAIPDTFLPMLGAAGMSTSSLGACITMTVIWFTATRKNMYTITSVNMSRYLWDGIKTGILVVDSDRKPALMNTYAEELLSVKHSEALLLTDIFDITEAELSDVYKELRHKNEVKRSWECRTAPVCCGITVTAEPDRFGELFCYLFAISDITREEKLIQEVMDSDRAKSDFLARMSHEIRTPINAVLGMDELILREGPKEPVRTYAENIASSGRSLLTIINDILDLSKIEAGKMEILCGNYSLASMLNDSCSIIAPKAAEKGLTVTLMCEEGLPRMLYGDEIRVRQILNNFLSNAVKYTEKGHIVLKAERVVLPDEPEKDISIRFSVEDTGIGIEKENLGKMFESFTRLDQERNYTVEGTGLGLAITRQLVELMNGSMSVESTYGVGSTFSVILRQGIADKTPVGHVSEEYEREKSEIARNTVLKLKAASVLVVDDVPMNIRVFEGLLKRTGLAIDSATGGEEALRLLRQNSYDMVFMDHMMPKMDGIETFRRFREELSEAKSEGRETKNADAKFIMLTANAIVGAKQEYLDEGFDDYLSKPIDGKKLEDMLVKYLPKEKIQGSRDVLCERDGGSGDLLSVLRESGMLDVVEGLRYSMGDEGLYREVLSAYLEENRTGELSDLLEQENWKEYRVLVHAVKSASYTIGASELGDHAKLLEDAAKAEDGEYIRLNHAAVMEEYEELRSVIGKALS